MELTSLLEKMKMEHLTDQLDTVCEQAAKRELDYKAFLAEALKAEWQGRYQRGVESRLKLARFPWLKIGEVIADNPGKVIMKTRIGGTRIIDMLSGEQLPRIC